MVAVRAHRTAAT